MKELINHIENLQQSCVKCPARIEIRKKFSEKTAKTFCKELCPTGKVIVRKQKQLELDVGWISSIANNLTQSQYEKLSKKYTDKEIAKKVGISTNALYHRKRAWGLTREETLLSDKTYEDYLELLKKDVSVVDIAKMWGVGRTTLYRFINRCRREKNL